MFNVMQTCTNVTVITITQTDSHSFNGNFPGQPG